MTQVSAKGIQEIVLEFDGTYVRVETDIPEIADFVRESHRPMVAHISAAAGLVVEVWRRPDGYSLKGRVVNSNRPPSSLFFLVKDAILQSFVASRPEFLWLHAGAVSHDTAGLLVVAPSAQGKSTLVKFLCELGWTYLSDEAAPISIANENVVPWPRSPVRRVHPGRDLSREELGEIQRERWQIPTSQIQTGPVHVEAIVFPGFQHGATPAMNLVPAGDAAMRLVRNAINFADHRHAAVSAAARLASRVPAHELVFENGREGALLVHRLHSGESGLDHAHSD